MKLILLYTLPIVVSACAMKPSYKDMILPDDIRPGYEAPINISSKQWKEDKAILLHSLKHGYSGRFNIKEEI